MNLTGPIESAEHQFKQIVEEFFISVYEESALPSHGLEHHRRVWNHAKELTLILAEQNLIKDLRLPFSLIIACYLHDLGMSVDRGIKHGRHSMMLCRKFLSENALNENDFPDLLQAVLNHDNKDYRKSAEKNDLLTILSIADDLDAFGFTGIYRYLEIYIMRGEQIGTLGHKIRQNACKRYVHFEEVFRFSESLVSRHRKRYEILDDFFSEYEKQAHSYSFDGVYEGYCGIAAIIMKIINEGKDLNSFINDPVYQYDDPIIIWFFKELRSEL